MLLTALGVPWDVVVEDYYDVADVPSVSGHRIKVRAHEPSLRAVETGRPVLDVFPDPTPLPAVARPVVAGARHSLAAPLMTAGEVVAVLLLYRRGEPGFNSEEVETLVLDVTDADVALSGPYQGHTDDKESSRCENGWRTNPVCQGAGDDHPG